ncbi:MAG: hypothetical protein ACRD2P_14020, partial [Terriglobia bacterium]
YTKQSIDKFVPGLSAERPSRRTTALKPFYSKTGVAANVFGRCLAFPPARQRHISCNQKYSSKNQNEDENQDTSAELFCNSAVFQRSKPKAAEF